MKKYLLDSNFWINAENYYPADVFPSFWNRLKSLIEDGTIVVHQTVLDEVDRKENEVSEWLHSVPAYEPMPISEDAFLRYLEICRWAEDESQSYTQNAIDEFEQNDRADAWICAQAAASNLVIVTNEKKSNSPNKVKIPNTCEAFGVDCLSNLNFMREQGFSF